MSFIDVICDILPTSNACKKALGMLVVAVQNVNIATFVIGHIDKFG